MIPKENNLYGLVYGCPHLERDNDCPLMHVEHLSFSKKVKWVDGLAMKKKKLFWSAIKFALKIDCRSDLLVYPFVRNSKGVFVFRGLKFNYFF